MREENVELVLPSKRHIMNYLGKGFYSILSLSLSFKHTHARAHTHFIATNCGYILLVFVLTCL
jgi:hypothetical protein